MWCDRVAERQRWAESADYTFDMAAGDYSKKALANQILDRDRPPSFLFREHVYGCFTEDAVGVRNIDLIGIDNLLLETDFPHADGTWPESIQIVQKELAPLGEDDMIKLLRDNARRVFQFTPAEAPF
jgi:hypothetical protein